MQQFYSREAIENHCGADVQLRRLHMHFVTHSHTNFLSWFGRLRRATADGLGWSFHLEPSPTRSIQLKWMAINQLLLRFMLMSFYWHAMKKMIRCIYSFFSFMLFEESCYSDSEIDECKCLCAFDKQTGLHWHIFCFLLWEYFYKSFVFNAIALLPKTAWYLI